jgi:hypothetical protein
MYTDFFLMPIEDHNVQIEILNNKNNAFQN